LTADHGEVLRGCWWAAVAALTSMLGDLDLAEDAVQEACLVAVALWPVDGVPRNPRAWLTGTARHKALDRLRREGARGAKEAAAMRELPASGSSSRDDELALMFMCCHPALDPQVRVALTLRCVCGLATADIAAAFLIPEPTLAQRLVRAKRKIRQAGIRFAVPGEPDLAERLACVLRVVYLVFTAGHTAATGAELVRGELCDEAVRLARELCVLLPGEPEAAGLLALLLLTDARREARLSVEGELVLLADQDRRKWDTGMIEEGERVLEASLRTGRPGPYQLQAAIAACHSCSVMPDWEEIAALYGELLRYEPSAVFAANRAVAVAMVRGPVAGLALLDDLAGQLATWPQFHIARAELLRLVGRPADAAAAYSAALELSPADPARRHLERRLRELGP
jgi:RNA polymerase sigma-70 factor, ECF subfamily